MFQTYEHAKINSSLTMKDVMLWQSISKVGSSFSLFIDVRYKDSELSDKNEIKFIDNIDELVSIYHDFELYIYDVQLFSPPSMNRSPIWKMQPIRSIHTGCEPTNKNQLAFIFDTDDNEYVDSRYNTPSDYLSHKKMLCEFDMLHLYPDEEV